MKIDLSRIYNVTKNVECFWVELSNIISINVIYADASANALEPESPQEEGLNESKSGAMEKVRSVLCILGDSRNCLSIAWLSISGSVFIFNQWAIAIMVRLSVVCDTRVLRQNSWNKDHACHFHWKVVICSMSLDEKFDDEMRTEWRI